MGAIEDFRPLIRPWKIHRQTENIIYEPEGVFQPVTLPIDAEAFLSFMDGNHTVQDIVRQFWTTQGQVHFKKLFLTLQRLKTGDLLLNGDELIMNIETEDNRYERTLHRFARPFITWNLFEKWATPTKHRGSFAFFCLGIIAVGALMAFKSWGMFIQSDFLKVNDNYGLGFLLFIGTAGALTTLKNILKTSLLMLAEGRVFGGYLQINVFGLSYRIEDEPSLFALTRVEAALYGLAILFSHFFWLAGFHLFFGASFPLTQLFPMAVLLTVIDTDPYTKSELTMLFKRFSSGDDFHELTPYFRKRSLLSAFDRRARIRNEVLLLFFSSIAVAWTFFAYYCSLSLKEIIPNLVLALDSQDLSGKLPAVLVFAGMILLNIYMIVDIFALIASNLLHPFTNKVYQVLTDLGKREQYEKNAAQIQHRLQNLPFFGDLSKQSLPLLIENGRLTHFMKGARLIIQGTTGYELFVLLEGTVQVRRREESGHIRTLAELQSPTVFGETAVLTDTKRTADVVATTKIKALVINKSTLDRFRVMGDPEDYDRLLQKIQLQQKSGILYEV